MKFPRKFPRCSALVLAAIMSCQNFGAQEQDDYTEKLIQFHAAYDPYFRKYFGCPATGGTIEDCKPTRGIRDWKLEEELIRKAEIFTK